MDQVEFKERTKQLGLRVIRLASTLPTTYVATVIGKQIVRSSTLVGANYRAACRARSVAAMIAKLDIVLEEVDETQYWLEILVDSGLVSQSKLKSLQCETDEIIALTVASLKTLRRRSVDK